MHSNLHYIPLPLLVTTELFSVLQNELVGVGDVEIKLNCLKCGLLDVEINNKAKPDIILNLFVPGLDVQSNSNHPDIQQTPIYRSNSLNMSV